MRRIFIALVAAAAAIGATIGSANASGPSGWSVVRTPNPRAASLHFGALDAVSCAGASACLAVGSGVDLRADQIAIAQTWNGTSWAMTPTARIRGSSASSFAAVSCTAANACTAVGFATNAAALTLPLAERWNGSVWSVQAVPAGRGGSLAGVSCSSATDCMAVGATSDSSGQTVALSERWDGTSWQIVPTPTVPDTVFVQLSAVSCTAPNACTAVGSTTVATFGALAERWNGTAWSLESTPAPGDGVEGFLTGVSCTSATSCEAGGDYINAGFNDATLAEHWDGVSWSVQPTPNPAGGFILQVSGISCSTPTACTIAGWTNLGALVMRFNGSTWGMQPTPPPSGPPFSTAMLNGVACPTSTVCKAVGSIDGTLAESWDGSHWTLQTSPNTPGVLISEFHSVSCASASACVAVGAHDTAAGGNVALVERWDGTRWTMQPTPRVGHALTAMLSGVSCTAVNACTAVGSFDNSAGIQVPLAERWNGATWAIQAVPSPAGAMQASLSSVSCASVRLCVAVGVSQDASAHQSPLAALWNGSVWTLHTTPAPASALQARLAAVSCSNPGSCFAVGEYLNGAITVGRGHAHQSFAAQWNGTAWTATSIARPAGATAGYLDAISCTGASTCTAAGWYPSTSTTKTALAERWDGTTWTIDPSAAVSGAVLSGVVCSSASACTAVGSTQIGHSVAEVWNGATWSMEATPNPVSTARMLQSVACPTDTACVAVGTAVGSAGYNVTLAERYSG